MEDDWQRGELDRIRIEESADELGLAPSLMSPVFTFDGLECWKVLTHDFGLYAARTRLDGLPFSAPMVETFEDLQEPAQALYRELEDWARTADPYQ